MASVNSAFVERYGMTRLELRKRLYRRQGGRCAICRDRLPKKYVTSQHVNLDHRRPRSHGGADTLDNLDLVHKRCNLDKGDSCVGCQKCR